jgi:hypothetical protein
LYSAAVGIGNLSRTMPVPVVSAAGRLPVSPAQARVRSRRSRCCANVRIGVG